MSDILGDLFAARGYGRSLAQRELETAWEAALGEPLCRQARPGEVRRGVLNVTVSHPALLEELAAFRKPELLAALRSGAPSTIIHDIRFRVGPIGPGQEDEPGTDAKARPDARAGGRAPAPSRRGTTGTGNGRRRGRGPTQAG